MVVVAGQTGVDPVTRKLVAGGIKAQTRQAIANTSAILATERLALRDVVKHVPCSPTPEASGRGVRGLAECLSRAGRRRPAGPDHDPAASEIAWEIGRVSARARRNRA